MLSQINDYDDYIIPTGSILLRNWKPLSLNQVSDSPHKTVGDILNDLTNHATLRVLVRRYSISFYTHLLIYLYSSSDATILLFNLITLTNCYLNLT